MIKWAHLGPEAQAAGQVDWCLQFLHRNYPSWGEIRGAASNAPPGPKDARGWRGVAVIGAGSLRQIWSLAVSPRQDAFVCHMYQRLCLQLLQFIFALLQEDRVASWLGSFCGAVEVLAVECFKQSATMHVIITAGRETEGKYMRQWMVRWNIVFDSAKTPLQLWHWKLLLQQKLWHLINLTNYIQFECTYTIFVVCNLYHPSCEVKNRISQDSTESWKPEPCKLNHSEVTLEVSLGPSATWKVPRKAASQTLELSCY